MLACTPFEVDLHLTWFKSDLAAVTLSLRLDYNRFLYSGSLLPRSPAIYKFQSANRAPVERFVRLATDLPLRDTRYSPEH